jgi:hypothetical protein
MKSGIFVSSFLLACLSTSGEASTTLCNIEGGLLFKSVGWNSETGEAKVGDIFNKQHTGKVVLVRQQSNGIVTNIEFIDGSFEGEKHTGELVIFPVDKTFRVMGMRYTDTQPRRLDVNYGNTPAVCVTM